MLEVVKTKVAYTKKEFSSSYWLHYTGVVRDAAPLIKCLSFDLFPCFQPGNVCF